MQPQPQPQVIVVQVPRKRRWPWVLAAFTALTLLCCGACTAIVSPLFGEYPSRLQPTPDEVAGLRKDTNGIVKLIEAEAVFRLRASEHVDDAFAANYVDPKAPRRNVIVFGGTGLIWDPAKTLAAVIQGANPKLTNVTDFAPGPLGGELKCANGKDDQGKHVIYCAWIDHGSMGIGVFYGGRSMSDSAELLAQLRRQIILRP